MRRSTAEYLSAAVLCVSVLAVWVVPAAGCGDATQGTTVSEAATTTTDPIAEALTFPVDDYVVQTKKVGTSDGTVSITYHLYQHLAYVARPVDLDYQSLDIAVPVKIDGQEVDASDAPILFAISVGDYLSSPNRLPLDVPATTTDDPMTSTVSTALEQTSDTVSDITARMDLNADLALAAGYVVVSPGCRGSDNLSADGAYFGKAPAAIVDLKCAVKYLRYNDGLVPGDSSRIISTGCDAGGALSALLGASGDSDLYQPYFDDLGAAVVSDAIFASAAYCPTTDLQHADGAYEWQFGTTPLDSVLVDQALSAQLASGFAAYLTSLDLVGRSGFGTVTADNYGEYLVQTYLTPVAKEYLASLTEDELQAYLSQNPWITGDDGSVSFAWEDLVASIGRTKGLPAFDSFDLSTPECRLFGDSGTDARHFTEFSLRQTGETATAVVDPNLEPPSLDPDLQAVVDLMNPMYFITEKNAGCVRHWWIRHGVIGSETSMPVVMNLATSLENLGKDVNTTLYWEAGHGANLDPTDLIDWIAVIISSGG